MTSLLGQITADGVCLVIAVWLIVANRGKGKLTEVHEDSHTAWWAIAFGIFAQSATQAVFKAPAQVGGSVAGGVSGQFNGGAGATALILIIVVFATKPRPVLDFIGGAAIPAAVIASGSVLALPFTSIASVLRGLVGA